MAKARKAKVKKEKPSLETFQDEIRHRAEELYKNRGGEPGDELSDWLAAEKEIKKKYGIK